MIEGGAGLTKKSNGVEGALDDGRNMFRKGELRVEGDAKIFCGGVWRNLRAREKKRVWRNFSTLT